MNSMPFAAQRGGLAALALVLSIATAHAQDTIGLTRADDGVVLETSATADLPIAGEAVTPGDSIPTRLIRLSRPLSDSCRMTKSFMPSPGL